MGMMGEYRKMKKDESKIKKKERRKTKERK